MNFSKQHVRFNDIDFKDVSFQITTTPVKADLVQSIKTMGIINPPVLIYQNKTYSIICGFRRIAACFELDLPGIDVAVVQADPLECAKLAITENSLQRPLNWIETSRALKMLFKYCPGKKQILTLLSDLGLPDNLKMAQKILLLADFSPSIQEGLISGQIPFPVALELGALESETGSRIANIFQELGPGLNVQREMLVLIKEIAAKESIDILEILKDKSVSNVLENTDLDRTQKRLAFRDLLKTRRYPVIQKAQKTFETNLKNLKLPPNIRLIAPKYFESSRYRFQMDFSSVSQLTTCIDLLRRKAESPVMKDILNGYEPFDG